MLCNLSLFRNIAPVSEVSILVLVDYALQPGSSGIITSSVECFNPCFSGLCSATSPDGSNVSTLTSCFNPCFSGLCSATLYLRLFLLSQASFNPCFSGLCSATSSIERCEVPYLSFNPCFSGLCSATTLTEFKAMEKH